MKIDIAEILSGQKSRLDFAFEADFSELDFFGERPFAPGARVTGSVTSEAYGPKLSFRIDAEMTASCASCGRPVQRSFSHCESAHLTDDLDSEDEDALFFEGSTVDLAGPVNDAVVLGMDMRVLCDEDCKGLCPRCGADLNGGPCPCPPETDPRFDKLKELL